MRARETMAHVPHTDQNAPDLGVDTAVRRVREHLAALELPFETVTAGQDRAERERTLHQIAASVLPRPKRSRPRSRPACTP